MSQNESSLVIDEALFAEVDFNKVIKKMEKCIQDSKEKDDRLKNSQFVIEKINDRLAETLEELKKKDEIAAKLKEELAKVQKELRKTLIDKSKIDQLQEKQNRLTKTAEKSIQKLHLESEQKNEQINKLNNSNFALTSEKRKLLEEKHEKSDNHEIQMERNLNKAKADLKKVQKERDYFEKLSEELKNSISTLKESNHKLYAEFQSRKIEELIHYDLNFDKIKESEVAQKNVNFTDFRRMRKIQNVFAFTVSQKKSKRRFARFEIIRVNRFEKEFPIYSAFHVVKKSESGIEKEKQKIVLKYTISKLTNIHGDFEVKLANIDKRLKDLLIPKTSHLYFNVLQMLKKLLFFWSEFVSLKTDNHYLELMQMTREIESRR